MKKHVVHFGIKLNGKLKLRAAIKKKDLLCSLYSIHKLKAVPLAGALKSS